MLKVRRIDETDVQGKRVLVRCDFNVPIRDGRVTEDTRVRAHLKTINYLLERGCSVILMSHLGRPKGKSNPEFSLKPVVPVLSEHLKRPVTLAPDCIGPDAEKLAAALKPGEVLLLENLRFHKEEEKNDPDFARKLAVLASVYVNDAFAASHRAHASVVGLVPFVQSSCAGFLLVSEVETFNRSFASPARPLVMVLGGAKVSTKIGLIRNLLPKVDSLLIGGAMANTFIAARGNPVGKSLQETDFHAEAMAVLAEASSMGKRILLPVDVICAPSPDDAAHKQVVPVGSIPAGSMALDIGPRTAELFAAEIAAARTVVWNGPVGLFEMPGFDEGTRAIARAIAGNREALTVGGGGDTDAALEMTGLKEKFSHVSTGGGAFLELLEGRDLPAITALG
ncbi:MAG: phosphoglycerate kinase [Deltaproteobacteria bacterium]|nr:phosphoglycerate kinase [Deltaproteobacteria bacterium]